MSDLPLVVNGEQRTWPEDAFPADVEALVESLGVDPETVVAEVNGNIVERASFATTPLRPGAQVELIRVVGGG